MRLYRKRYGGKVYKHFLYHDSKPIRIYTDTTVKIKKVKSSTQKTNKKNCKTKKELYYEYLQSKEWQKLRTIKLNREEGTKKRCAFCGAIEYLQVHHLVYPKKLKNTKQSMLRVVCKKCHELIHELIKKGLIRFKDRDPRNRFRITKYALLNNYGIYFKSQSVTFVPEFDAETENRLNYILTKDL